jgi:uncharacterized protein (DUF2267 family)
LDVFDKTLQTTHVWLNELCEEIGPDAHLAWHVLGAVLRATRDRLPMDLGTYYDRLRPSELPSKLRSLDEFLDGIEAELAMNRPVNSRGATRAVFQILSRHVNRGQIEKVRQALPEDVRAIWHDDPNAPDVRKRPQRYARAANRRTDPRPKRGKPTTKPEKRASRGKHGGNRGGPGARISMKPRRSSQAAGKDPTRRVAHRAGRSKSSSPMG